MDGLDESVMLDTDVSETAGESVDLGGDSYTDPFEAAINELLGSGSKADEDSAEEADGGTEEQKATDETGGDDADAKPEDKPDDKPAAKSKSKQLDDDVDPKPEDLRDEVDGRSTVDKKKWNALLRLKNVAAEALIGKTDDPDAKPTVKVIREAVETFAPIATKIREAGIDSPDDLEEAIKLAEERKSSIVEFRSEDPRDVANFLHNLASTDKEAFGRMLNVLPEYLQHVDPPGFASFVERMPDFMGRLTPEAYERVETALASRQISHLENKLRGYMGDNSISDEQRALAKDFYVRTIQTLEFELSGKARSEEEITGQKPSQPQTNPHEEELRRVREEQRMRENQSREQWFERVKENATADIQQKVRERTDELFKPFEGLATTLVADAAKEKIYAGIWATAQKYYPNDLRLLAQARDAIRGVRTNEELRSKFSTLVENHATLIGKAMVRYRQTQEFVDLKREIQKGARKPEAEKPAVVQTRTPAPSTSNSQAVRPTSPERKAQTADELFDSVFMKPI